MADNRRTNRYFMSSAAPEIRRENNFVLTLNLGGISTKQQHIDLYVMKAFLPSISLNVIDLRRGNDTLKFAGAATWTGGTLEILDTTDDDTYEAIIEWFNKGYDPDTGSIGLAKDYKVNGTITEYVGNGKMGRVWNLTGMWISSFDFGTLNAESDSLKRVQLTIQIDPTTGKLFERESE